MSMNSNNIYSFVENETDEVITILNKCNWCSEENQINVSRNSWRFWMKEKNYIQKAFHYLSPEIRELIKTGTHPKCWKEMFESDEDE